MATKNALLVIKIFIFILISFGLTKTAISGKWIKHAKGKNFTEYCSNAARSGRIASIDSLRDYDKEKSPKNQKYLSKKTRLQFDCSRKKFKIISVQKYTENMMQGNLLKSKQPSSSWQKVMSNSLNEMYLEKACNVRVN